ncbi:hypothetical protein EGW08_005107, partial [Elysia chlorotica]
MLSALLKPTLSPDRRKNFVNLMLKGRPHEAWITALKPLPNIFIKVNNPHCHYQTKIHVKKAETPCWTFSYCRTVPQFVKRFQANISRYYHCWYAQAFRPRSNPYLSSSRHCSTWAKTRRNRPHSMYILQPIQEARHLSSSVLSSHGSTPASQLVLNTENCETPETLMESINCQINDNSLLDHQIASVANQYRKLVFASLSLPYLSDNFHFRMSQIEFTASASEKVKKMTTDPKWEHFMSFIASRLDSLPLGDQAALLNCLSSLFVSSESKVCRILLDNCLTNIGDLTLKQLVLVSDVCCKVQDNCAIKEKIRDTLHAVMSNCQAGEIDISNLCCALVNVRSVLGEETLKLFGKIVKSKLELDSSSISPGILVKAYQLFIAEGLLYLQDLELDSLHSMMREVMCLNDLPVMGANLASSVEHPWPISHLLTTVSEFCKADLEACLHASTSVKKFVSFAKLSYCLESIDADLLLCVIREADIFLLVQMIGHHMAVNLSDRATIQTYHDRFLQLSPGLGNILDREQSSQEIMLKFFRLMSRVGIEPDSRLTEPVSSALGFDAGRASLDTPPAVVEILYQSASETLGSDSLLSLSDLSTLIQLAPKLTMGSMLLLSQRLDEIFEMPHRSGQVKKQTQKLRTEIRKLFLERLAEADDLPTSLFGAECNRNSFPQPRTLCLGLFEDLLSSLNRFVISGKKYANNCLGALAVLDLTSKPYPFYQEELLEELSAFVIRECPRSLTPACQVLTALASAGYLPRDCDHFIDWLWSLVGCMLEDETIDKSLLVQMAYNMSVLGLFHDRLLVNIFSLRFIGDLHAELRDKGSAERGRAHECLELLSRSVAIECPHLAVPCLYQPNNDRNKHSPRMSRRDSQYVEKVVASLTRLCPDGHCVIAPSQSPYSHHI